VLDAWLRINVDGTATIFPGKVELGQGITTALAQIVAEELDLPLARVHMIPPDTARPDEGITSRSELIKYGGVALRLASVEARAPHSRRSGCETARRRVRNPHRQRWNDQRGRRSLSHGELAGRLITDKALRTRASRFTGGQLHVLGRRRSMVIPQSAGGRLRVKSTKTEAPLIGPSVQHRSV